MPVEFKGGVSKPEGDVAACTAVKDGHLVVVRATAGWHWLTRLYGTDIRAVSPLADVSDALFCEREGDGVFSMI
jgi:hypothetical protein